MASSATSSMSISSSFAEDSYHNGVSVQGETFQGKNAVVRLHHHVGLVLVVGEDTGRFVH